MPTPRDYIDHIAGVWAQAGRQQHNHHNGWQNCPICRKHADKAKHDHAQGLAGCKACMTTAVAQCGNPTCPICVA